jgi:hypothetical protein
VLGRTKQIVARATLGGRKLTLYIVFVLIVLYFSLQCSERCSCCTCNTTPHSRLVIKGNTPDQDLLVGVVSFGYG